MITMEEEKTKQQLIYHHTAPITQSEIVAICKSLTSLKTASIESSTLTDSFIESTKITNSNTVINQLKIGLVNTSKLKCSAGAKDAIYILQSIFFDETGKFIGIQTREQQRQATWATAQFIQHSYPRTQAQWLINQLSEQNNITFLIRPLPVKIDAHIQQKIFNNTYNSDLLNTLRYCENKQFDQALPILQKYWNAADQLPQTSLKYVNIINNGASLFDHFKTSCGKLTNGQGIKYKYMLDPLWQDFYGTPTIYQAKINTPEEISNFRNQLKQRWNLKNEIVQNANVPTNSLNSYIAYRIIDNTHQQILNGLTTTNNHTFTQVGIAFNNMLNAHPIDPLRQTLAFNGLNIPIRTYRSRMFEFSANSAYTPSSHRLTEDRLQHTEMMPGRVINWVTANRAEKQTYTRNTIINDHINNFRFEESKYQIKLLEHDRISIEETLKPEFAQLRFDMSRTPALYQVEQYKKYLIAWPEGRQVIMSFYHDIHNNPKSDIAQVLKSNGLTNLFTHLGENYMRADLLNTINQLTDDKAFLNQLAQQISEDQFLSCSKNYYYNRKTIHEFLHHNPYELNDQDRATYLFGILPEECKSVEKVDKILAKLGKNKYEFYKAFQSS